MKLLKAFIRTDRVDIVVRSLKAAGAPGITVSRVHGVGYGYDPHYFSLAPRELPSSPEITKVEVVCRDRDTDRLLTALTESARTGFQGDGIVFVTPVERAVRVRTGEEGKIVLAAKSQPTN